MTAELKLAWRMSLGVHAAALLGLPFSHSVTFDVERAPTSMEIVLVAPKAPIVAVAPEPTPPSEPPREAEAIAPEPPTPEPETLRAYGPIGPEAVARRAEQRQRGALADVLPDYLRNPPPTYPLRARQLGQEGSLVLDVEVLPSGRCGQVRMAQSSGHTLLDEASVRAVRQWQFKSGRPLVPRAIWVEIPITFRLTEEKR